MGNPGPQELMEVILHPVRMRILKLLAGKPGMTAQQLADALPGVPQATLYRHINRVYQAGLLQVVEERPVRGTVEKMYALRISAAEKNATPEEQNAALSQMSKEEHLRFFTSFVLTLIDDFSHYLSAQVADKVDLAADGVGYHKLPLFLTDEEFASFTGALNQALLPYVQNESTPGRRKRLFSTILMPYDD